MSYAFLCHASEDSAFVILAAQYLKKAVDRVFYYEEHQRADQHFIQTLGQALHECDYFLLFVGDRVTQWQVAEANIALQNQNRDQGANAPPGGLLQMRFLVVRLPGPDGIHRDIPHELAFYGGFPLYEAPARDAASAIAVASIVANSLDVPLAFEDDLPLDPSIFSYEKETIQFFSEMQRLGPALYTAEDLSQADIQQAERMRETILSGCPSAWPEVPKWQGWQHHELPEDLQKRVGTYRDPASRVGTAALLDLMPQSVSADAARVPSFPLAEAGPRETHVFPRNQLGRLNVAVMVSGGIAPGINAVIDGIVQRHWLYADCCGHEHGLTIYGLENGLRALFDGLADHAWHLYDKHRARSAQRPLITAEHVSNGGSMLGTSRVDSLIAAHTRLDRLRDIDEVLRQNHVDILYVIGGDGSMKAAHALSSVARSNSLRQGANAQKLSVIGIPKSMDNDILWVWQSFGFLSAVEKAREVVEHLSTEVTSNPRLCVVQLFGSDSGFVVSHAVLASATGHCCLALIPEVPFSMASIAQYLRGALVQRNGQIPFGLVVLSETAIPTDAMDYVSDAAGNRPAVDVGLSPEEEDAIREYDAMRSRGERLQGQTSDFLRSAGLKIVSRGLQRSLPDLPNLAGQPQGDWARFRVITNEPRHVLRSVAPSTSDVITGHRLGTLAVDNAMAGFHDCMISQWLTEFVLVPLKLVVLGRKRIPTSGIFWLSVQAKTGQPHSLV